MKRMILASLVLVALSAVPVGAINYEIAGVAQTEFYPSTPYDDVYGAAYQYGETNVSDFTVDQLPYGTFSATSMGVLDKPTSSFGISYAGTSFAPVTSGGGYGTTTPSYTVTTPTYTPTVQTTKFTDADDILRNNGTLGTLSIPAIDVYAKVKPNETMSYSVGHISSTSAWDGNVGICGHNRGSSVVIGDIKDLELGDRIVYTTDLGSRTYSVISVSKISNTDWSNLTATTDNRITLITCIENQSNYRWCVIATEISW